MGLEKSLEAIHLIQGEMTQPPTGTVTWVCCYGMWQEERRRVLGSLPSERLKDDWQHVAAEFLKQRLGVDTDTEAGKVFFQFKSR